jgi:hypothetical protein
MTADEIISGIQEYFKSIGATQGSVITDETDDYGGILIFAELTEITGFRKTPEHAKYLKVYISQHGEQRMVFYFVDNGYDSVDANFHFFDNETELKIALVNAFLTNVPSKLEARFDLGKLIAMETRLDTLLKTLESNKQRP